MLAELAAANAAFSIIKQTVSHGKDLMSAGKAISQLVAAEEDLRAKGTKRKTLSGERLVKKLIRQT